MVDVEQLVDPELEGLLRELASRPRSVFLRSSRKDAMRVLRSRTTPGVSALAVSDALERELVTVHRAELAEILKEACRTRLLEGEREKFVMMPYTGAGKRHRPTSIQSLRLRLERASEREADLSPNSDNLLRNRSPLRDALQERSVLDLAALGQRLLPCDAWRLLAAISLISNQSTRAAHALARAVLDGWPELGDSLRALEVLALSEVLMGRPDLALAHQEEACSLRGDYPLGLINLVRYGLLAVQEEKVLAASNRMSGMIELEHPLVAQSCAADRTRRRDGYWGPTEATMDLACRLESTLGDVAREVSLGFH